MWTGSTERKWIKMNGDLTRRYVTGQYAHLITGDVISATSRKKKILLQEPSHQSAGHRDPDTGIALFAPVCASFYPVTTETETPETVILNSTTLAKMAIVF